MLILIIFVAMHVFGHGGQGGHAGSGGPAQSATEGKK
jgi:hypothetical protein